MVRVLLRERVGRVARREGERVALSREEGCAEGDLTDAGDLARALEVEAGERLAGEAERAAELVVEVEAEESAVLCGAQLEVLREEAAQLRDDEVRLERLSAAHVGEVDRQPAADAVLEPPVELAQVGVVLELLGRGVELADRAVPVRLQQRLRVAPDHLVVLVRHVADLHGEPLVLRRLRRALERVRGAEVLRGQRSLQPHAALAGDLVRLRRRLPVRELNAQRDARDRERQAERKNYDARKYPHGRYSIPARLV